MLNSVTIFNLHLHFAYKAEPSLSVLTFEVNALRRKPLLFTFLFQNFDTLKSVVQMEWAAYLTRPV